MLPSLWLSLLPLSPSTGTSVVMLDPPTTQRFEITPHVEASSSATYGISILSFSLPGSQMYLQTPRMRMLSQIQRMRHGYPWGMFYELSQFL